MFQNLFKHKIDEYLAHAKVYGDMRRAWSQHVWWTREVIIGIAQGLPSTTASVNKLLTNPATMMAVFGNKCGQVSTGRLQALFATHLSMGGDIVAASKAGDMAKAQELTRQWYANADDIAREFARCGYSEEMVRQMMYDHLRLTLMEASQYLQGKYPESIATFDQIQAEAEQMADYFSRGITGLDISF